MARRWHVRPGEIIELPEGSEFMRRSGGSEIWYNPFINKSYYITGHPDLGWDVIEYDSPLCDQCWERYRRYTRDGV